MVTVANSRVRLAMGLLDSDCSEVFVEAVEMSVEFGEFCMAMRRGVEGKVGDEIARDKEVSIHFIE